MIWNPSGNYVETRMEFQWIIYIQSSGKPVGDGVEALWVPCGNQDGLPMDNVTRVLQETSGLRCSTSTPVTPPALYRSLSKKVSLNRSFFINKDNISIKSIQLIYGLSYTCIFNQYCTKVSYEFNKSEDHTLNFRSHKVTLITGVLQFMMNNNK